MTQTYTVDNAKGYWKCSEGDAMTTREEILDQAKAIVSVDRNADYGEPEQNFQRIATMWNAYLGADTQPLDAYDVAAMLILLKVARVATSPGIQDHWIDIAGYAACGGEVRPKV